MKNVIGNNSLSNTIAEKIMEQIILGELKPGEKIKEVEFAKEFQVSRAPVREALYLLKQEGFIERLPRKGSVVKSYSISEAYDLLCIRMMIEKFALDKIINNGFNNIFIDEMKTLVIWMEKNKGKNYPKLNYEFHLLIIKMSESDAIQRIYSQLGLPLLTLQTLSFMNNYYVEESLKDHKEIILSLESGKINQAKEILDQHNRKLIARVEKRLPISKGGDSK